MTQSVHVIGVGMTRFAKHLDRTLKSLVAEAVGEALADAGLTASQLQAAYFGTAATAVTVGQVMVPGQAALRAMGISRIPVVNVENACASAATAFQQAFQLIAPGGADVVLAVGAEKLFCADREKTFAVFNGAVDFEDFERVSADLKRRIAAAGVASDEGAGSERSLFMDIYAAMALEHMQRHGSTQRDFAEIAAKTSFHGSLNPKAQFQQVLSVEEVLAARPITWPLTLPMCSPIGDGAAAAILASQSFVRRTGCRAPVRVRASVLRSGWNYGPEEQSVAEEVAREAYSTAGIDVVDIDVVELHDASAPAELIYYEHLGLCPRGEGARFVREGHARLGGRTPVNPSGGLLRKGHPVGATGLAQIHELTLQLRGAAGARQVEGARIAVAENGGGYLGHDAAAMVVSVLES